MTTGTDNLSLLPTPLVSTILECCETKDALALSFTCRRFRTLVERSMCLVDELGYSSAWRIPIYFADQCHSVFIMCEFHPPRNMKNEIYDVSVRSRTRHQLGERDSIVWQAVRHVNDGIMATSYISFRNDPSKEYFLHTDPRHYHASTLNICKLQKQFMTTNSTRMMEIAIKNCLLFQEKCSPLSDNWSTRHPMQKGRLLMKLFVFCSKSVSEESTAIRTFFTSSRVGQDRLSLTKKQILNLFEQVLEQKEPAFCTKRLLSREEMALNGQRDPNAPHPHSQNTSALSTPTLNLVEDFSWDRSTKRQCMDQDDTFLRGHGLEFVARIPLAHKSTALTCSAFLTTDAPCKAFVFFFQRSVSNHFSSEKQIDGKVLSCQGISGSWTVELELDREYEACFLYIVPGKTSSISIRGLRVELKLAAADHNPDFRYWIDGVMTNLTCCGPNFHHRLFIIALLREAVMALLGQDRESFTTLKQDLDMEGLITTPEGLDCMLSCCDVILRDWKLTKP